MNWNEYLALSEKTLSEEFHSGKKVENLLHGVIGILTELDELIENHEKDNFDSINAVEEISDVMWYIAILAREYKIDLPKWSDHENESPTKNPERLILSMIKNSLKLLDMIKKKIYYNKIIDDNQFIALTHNVIANVLQYMNYYKIDIHKSFDINIEKLKARYGDKFSSEMAINRNLDIERQILEK